MSFSALNNFFIIVTVVIPRVCVCVCVCVSVRSFLPPRAYRLRNIGMYVRVHRDMENSFI